MQRTFLALSHSGAAIAFVVAVTAASGCSSAGGSSANALPNTNDARTMRVGHKAPAPAPTPITFTFTGPIDDPISKSNDNRVTGINNAREIVGNFGDDNDSLCGISNDPLNSFTSQWPYSAFSSENLPGADGTYLSSLPLKSSTIQAGYVCEPHSLDPDSIWGTTVDQGIWTIIPKHSGEGMNSCKKWMKLFGINDSYNSVGAYKDPNCNPQPIEVSRSEVFTSFSPPNAVSAVATGISDTEAAVGFETLASGAVQGWYAPNGAKGNYFVLSYPNSASTTPSGINSQGYVVGSYTDRSNKVHGFLLFNPAAPPSQMVWQEIDEPKNLGVTVVSGINDGDDICGWYKGASSEYHGFVAMPSGSMRNIDRPLPR